jgi:hypothetical protein
MKIENLMQVQKHKINKMGNMVTKKTKTIASSRNNYVWFYASQKIGQLSKNKHAIYMLEKTKFSAEREEMPEDKPDGVHYKLTMLSSSRKMEIIVDMLCYIIMDWFRSRPPYITGLFSSLRSCKTTGSLLSYAG